MRVIVLMGGRSAERTISLQSGCAVATALESLGHHVIRIDPAITDLRTFEWPQSDLVFIALHGTFGEDGQVQAILEKTDIPYTGSGPTASRLAFHKSEAKKIFLRHNILTPNATVFTDRTEFEEIEQQAQQLGYPVFVKPEAQGSSIGVSMVKQNSELEAAIRLSLQYDSTGLVEKAVTGTEWTLGLFEETVFPLIQIKYRNRFYDHHAKYEDDATDFVVDPDISPEIKQKLVSAGIGAYRSLGVSGVARVDLILDQQNEPSVLEVNTIPGMTDHSNIPLAARAMGWSFPSLCEKICRAAIESKKMSPPLLHRDSYDR